MVAAGRESLTDQDLRDTADGAREEILGRLQRAALLRLLEVDDGRLHSEDGGGGGGGGGIGGARREGARAVARGR